MGLVTPEWELRMKSGKDGHPLFPRKETPSMTFLPSAPGRIASEVS
jgi:hypothetical protein